MYRIKHMPFKNFYKNLFVTHSVIILFSFCLLTPGYGINPSHEFESVLKDFERQLSYDQEYRVICKIASFFPEKKPYIKKFVLYNKGHRSLLVTLEPERDKGKKILMDNNELWQYFPDINKSIIFNSGTNLNGRVNLTDIISFSLFNFYEFSNMKFDEKIKTYIITFNSKTKNSPYGQVVYYFTDKKIEHFEAYARSGLLLKKIFFSEYVSNKDNFFPLRLKITNELSEGDYSLIQMSEIESIKIPDYYFNPNTLGKVPVQIGQ